MALSSAEQLFLELVNRARLDPAAEARRQKIDLNEGLKAGTISTDSKQVLAPHSQLESAATAHSLWMLKENVFQHEGVDKSMPWQRAQSFGYQYGSVGENLALYYSAPKITIAKADLMQIQFNGLYKSKSHRENMMLSMWGETGIGEELGSFKVSGTVTAASMLTNVFGKTPVTKSYLTGVVYTDSDKNDFYSIGEGQSGAKFTIAGVSARSTASGGYALLTDALENAVVSGKTASGSSFKAYVDMSLSNVKFDIVNDSTILSSGSLKLHTGLNSATLLGVEDLSLSGNSKANVLTGNSGDNKISGLGGADRLFGLGGDDFIFGGSGNDRINGGAGRDRLYGDAGNDTIKGGGGADWLYGGAGNDVLFGGSGADRFVFETKFGNDRVQDFSLAQKDRLQLDQDLWAGNLKASAVVNTYASVTKDGVLFDFGDQGTVLLAGLDTVKGLAAQIDLI